MMFDRLFARNEFTGWHMAVVMGLFFGTIIAVNVTLAVFAGSSWSGLVVKNTYVASQKFNEETARRAAEAALGWRAVPTYAEGRFDLALAGPDGDPIRHAVVTATLGRPATEVEDRALQLLPAGDGYSAPVELASGIWQAELAVIGPKGERWSHAYRFTVDAP